jgi:hypothetical protein
VKNLKSGESPRYIASLVGLVVSLNTATALAQLPGTAVRGEPFGVASVRIRLPAATTATFWQSRAFTVEEPNRRVLYPAFRAGLLARVDSDAETVPGQVDISFLFTGSSPLEVTVMTPEPVRFNLTPQAVAPRVFRRTLIRWWRDYHADIRQQERDSSYPTLPDVYLSSMLSRRLGLAPPLLSRIGQSPSTSELKETVQLLLGDEELRNSLAREMMTSLGDSTGTVALAVPEEIYWEAPDLPPPPDVEIEPIANHVPVDCFYIRFGTFPNYLWCSKLLRELGGQFGQIVSLRGQDAKLNQRLQYQLALKESKLAEVFGSQVIADVALIGRDLYLADGASIGVLFQAKNNPALRADLQQQRATALRAEAANSAEVSDITIAGRTVSLLSTSDNRLRSFYAESGDFHLVTTSESIVERFFAAGEGRGTLADSAEFQLARRTRPLSTEDTIFAFFPPAFFRGLISPQYQIEMHRRQHAAVAIDVVKLARWAALAEGRAASTLEDLTTGGFLPNGFGRLADGSGPILATEQVFDSFRGARGSFVPVADIALRSVTSREAETFRATAEYFEQNWRQFDPLLVGVKRVAGQNGQEQIEIDANISPLAEEKYGWVLSILGPPSTHWISPAPGDVISMQAMVQGGLSSPSIAPHHLFMGIQDIAPTTDIRPTGILQIVQLLRATPGYLGSWPKFGWLDRLPLRLGGGPPDAYGFSQLPLGLWRWQGGGFTVLSFQPNVLAHVTPELRPEPTDNPAQIRIQVGDLSQSQLAGWLNLQYYERARQASVGNARLLHMLNQQFHVPLESSSETVEELLKSELVCALSGEYQLVERDGVLNWESTAWPDREGSVPKTYEAPLLQWFRGGHLDLIKTGDRLTLHAEVQLQRLDKGGLFDLFRAN